MAGRNLVLIKDQNYISANGLGDFLSKRGESGVS